jgi:platelet-activating factor acetylhydrolase
MLSLPSVQGRFPVGITTFATPVKPSRRVGNAQLKNVKISSSGTSYAFNLEEVAFAAYYPANTSNRLLKGVDWLLRFVTFFNEYRVYILLTEVIV